jgi:hypothetical protein
MSYPPGPYEGSPGWPGQQPGWQPQQPPPPPPGWQGQQPGWQGQPEPENYLVWAILCTVLCCLPVGIVSLVYSNKVSGLWTQGRYAEAQAAADNAKKWAIIGAIAGAVFAVIIVVLWVSFAVFVSNLPVTTTTTTYPGF